MASVGRFLLPHAALLLLLLLLLLLRSSATVTPPASSIQPINWPACPMQYGLFAMFVAIKEYNHHRSRHLTDPVLVECLWKVDGSNCWFVVHFMARLVVDQDIRLVLAKFAIGLVKLDVGTAYEVLPLLPFPQIETATPLQPSHP
ncbi:hypothetical protein AXF42_Ash014472 [Apostasia shenzhenica]|uniref:Uncharacterized protein n=1 Tax=Apostasia shenzhenica TaxID=1088818 RepID=A0A2H9ZWK6_9ASPA|nr:hypothetical protein AXF42_Ash014472 [Apostasia shenzhenica]